MALTPVSNTVEFVQDTVPSTANDGDSWLDTSLSPPRLKIFDADAGGFVEPRSVRNLDVPVSTARPKVRFINGFSIGTASFTNISFDVTAQDISPTGAAFNGDGTVMFVVGRSSDSVYQYALTRPFDLSSASFINTSFSVSGQETSPTGVAFNNDGTVMFVVGNNSDSVHQYALTTGFDLSTASFTNTSFSVSGQDGFPQDVAFNNDGTVMFVMGNNTQSVYQYTLTTGFDLSTASFTNTSFSVSGQESAPEDVTFNSDGTLMFVPGGSSDSVHKYELTKPFDLSTASFTNTSFSVGGQTSTPAAVVFNNDGTLMFIVDVSSNNLFQYTVGSLAPR
jgi:sugar lactone lactonase YvrE